LGYLADLSTLRSLKLDSIQLNKTQFKDLLEGLYESNSMSELTLSRIDINSDYKMILLNGFLTVSNSLKKLVLIDNGLQDLEIFRDIHRNKNLTEIVICEQNFERQKVEYNKDGSRKNEP
jgi:hypothetical protein